MKANGVAFKRVTSLFRNHDGNEYAKSDDEAAVNRGLPMDDWNTADYFVNNGADPCVFTMAIEDMSYTMRDFAYGDQSQWRNLNEEQKINGMHLPKSAPTCSR